MIKVNMAKAREIKKNLIRAERAPRLAELDVAFMRAVEVGDLAAQQNIAVQKQALRDATDDPAIANAKTPEELKDVVPLALQSA